MHSKRLISLLCLIAYLVAFAHSVVPHEYHVHSSLALCLLEEYECNNHSCDHHESQHHHHFPHHSCDQFSTVYELSASQDDVQMPDMGLVVPVLLPVPVTLSDEQADAVAAEMDDAPPPLPAHGSVTGFRAPPVA